MSTAVTRDYEAVDRAREALDAAVREQLLAAFERGKQAQRHRDDTGSEVLADAQAPEAFGAVGIAADDYAAALTAVWRQP